VNLKHLIPVIFISLIFILGQTQCQKSQETPASGYYQYTGDKAVEARFVPNLPVSSSIDTYEPNEDIDVAVELTNRLTEPIPAGKVRIKLTGDAAVPNFFTGGDKVYTAPELPAIDPTTGGTSPEEVEIGPLRYVGDLSAKVSKKITAKYCYEVPIKVKANIFYTDSAQELSGKVNLPRGSNPPSRVKVVDIKQGVVDVKDGEGELRFQITIKNTGDGTIIDSLDDCFKYRENHREKLKLKVTGAYDIKCDDEVKFPRGGVKEKTINCKVTGIDPSNINSEPSELTIELYGFAYEEDIQPVTIWFEP